MVTSIRNFAQEMGSNHVVKNHAEKARSHTLTHSATNDLEYEEMLQRHRKKHEKEQKPKISAPFDVKPRTVEFDVEKAISEPVKSRSVKRSSSSLTHGMKKFTRANSRKPKVLLLREERDRFDQMRAIQKNTNNFKRYSALTMSIIACQSMDSQNSVIKG